MTGIQKDEFRRMNLESGQGLVEVLFWIALVLFVLVVVLKDVPW